MNPIPEWISSLILAELSTFVSIITAITGAITAFLIRFFKNDLQSGGFWTFLNPSIKHRHHFKTLTILLEHPSALSPTIQTQQDVSRMYLTHKIDIAPIFYEDLIYVSTDTHRDGIQWEGLQLIQTFVASDDEGKSSRIYVNIWEKYIGGVAGLIGVALFIMTVLLGLAIIILLQAGAWSTAIIYLVPCVIVGFVAWRYGNYASQVALALYVQARYKKLLNRRNENLIKNTVNEHTARHNNPILDTTNPSPLNTLPLQS